MFAALAIPTEDPRSRTWRLRVFGATWLCYAGYYLCRRPWSISKRSVQEELQLDGSTLGDVFALYLFAYAVSQFLAGAAGKRFGPRAVLLWGMAASILCNVGFGFAGSAGALFLLMGLNGMAQATGWSANVGTMAAWFRRDERGAVMGLWTTNFQVGAILSGMLASFALKAWGWQWAFFTGALSLAGVWGVVYAFQRNSPADVGLPPPDDEGSPAAGEGGGLGWTREVIINIALVSVFYFCVKLIRYVLASWSAYFLQGVYHLEGDVSGYLSTMIDLCGMPGVVLTGWLSDRYFGGRRAGVSLLMTLVLLACCVVLYALGSASMWAFIVGTAVAGFALYGPDALMSGAGAMDVGSRRGATLAAGIISSFGSVGPIVQELVVGRMLPKDKTNLTPATLNPVFLLLIASALGAVAALTVAVVRNRRGCRPL
ncbi:MAG: hypothetical protein RL653_4420 [Pseudomonadota bacterium]|jgi:OPA family sugar phosphate sensor protein UhpC-like MFS transporter